MRVRRNVGRRLGGGRALLMSLMLVLTGAGGAQASATDGRPTGSMASGRTGHRATLLPHGQVLVRGGAPTSAELHDPSKGTWTPTGSMDTGRSAHTATLLPTGQVVVAAGEPGAPSARTASAQLEDPATGQWRSAGMMRTGWSNHTTTLLPDGTVLVAGDLSNNGPSRSSVELSSERTLTATVYLPLVVQGAGPVRIGPARILYTAACDPRTDPQHCNLYPDLAIFDEFYGTMRELGAQLTYKLPTSAADLAPFDVVIADFCSGVNATTVDLLRAYIAGGGSVVALGDNFCLGTPLGTSAAGVTLLTSVLGITVTADDDTSIQVFGPVLTHPLTVDVHRIYSYRHAYLTVRVPAQRVITTTDHVFMAVSAGAGTLVAIPDIGFVWGKAARPAVAQSDNFILWHNLLAWLIDQSRTKQLRAARRGLSH